MPQAADTVTAYCENIRFFLLGEKPAPAPLSQETIDEIKTVCHPPFRMQEQLKETVDTTKILLEKEIRARNRDPAAQERIITLYLLNGDIYRLHIALHFDDQEKINTALIQARKSIPKKMQGAQRHSKREEKDLYLKDRIARILRVVIIVIAFASFILAFHYPEYVSLLVPLPLICVIFLVPAINLWLNTIEQRLENAKVKADPTTANQAMSFLSHPQAAADLFVLLDTPSLESEYQKQYLDMLINIGEACKWIDSKKDHLSAKKAAFYEAANEAYSLNPTGYTPEFLNEWRKTFEELQSELKGNFGKNASQFAKKTAENPAYFLDRFRHFLQSATAEKLKTFLHQL